MDMQLRCECGTLHGQLDTRRSAGRARCYCKDCQAYARHLGREASMLDGNGGTEIVACRPADLRFMAGSDRLVCMSLGEGGLLRWYADCCRTAIGNTPRDRRTAYVGLVRACLPEGDAAMDAAFGPLRIALNVGSARGTVDATPAATTLGVLRIMRNVIGARLSGSFTTNPFFTIDDGLPISTPRVLSASERKALDRVG
jgi:hypothetical protein